MSHNEAFEESTAENYVKRVGDAARDTTLAEGLIKDSRGGIQAAIPHDNYSERKHRPREEREKQLPRDYRMSGGERIPPKPYLDD